MESTGSERMNPAALHIYLVCVRDVDRDLGDDRGDGRRLLVSIGQHWSAISLISDRSPPVTSPGWTTNASGKTWPKDAVASLGLAIVNETSSKAVFPNAPYPASRGLRPAPALESFSVTLCRLLTVAALLVEPLTPCYPRGQ
jgi:hypothetical protein